MKLKILPTHLRDKKRYLAFEVMSQQPLDREDVKSLIWKASGDLHGACGTSRLGLWVVKVWNCPSSRDHILQGILRCQREEISMVMAVLPTITRFKGGRVVFHSLGISGTIKSATTKFIKLK